MYLSRRQDFYEWKLSVSKILEIKYGLDIDMFEDCYDLNNAYESGRSTRLVVEDLSLLIT